MRETPKTLECSNDNGQSPRRVVEKFFFGCRYRVDEDCEAGQYGSGQHRQSHDMDGMEIPPVPDYDRHSDSTCLRTDATAVAPRTAKNNSYNQCN